MVACAICRYRILRAYTNSVSSFIVESGHHSFARNMDVAMEYSWPSIVYQLTISNNHNNPIRPLGRGVERQFFGALAPCSNPLAEEETFFLRQLALLLLAILKALAPLGDGVSGSAPLPERLPGVIEGSL